MRLLIIFLALAFSVGAQTPFLQPGQVIVATVTANTLRFVNPGGGTTSSVSVPVGGTIESVLWDPQNPNDVILGQGSGPTRLWRASFAATGATVVPLVGSPGGANIVHSPLKIQWDRDLQHILVVDTQSNDVLRVNAATGAQTAVTTGGTATWGGAGIRALAVDPDFGDIFVSAADRIYRVTPIPGTATPNISLLLGGLPGTVHELLIDPLDHQKLLVSTAAASGAVRLLKVDQVTLNTEVVLDAHPGGASALESDPAGQLILGRSTSIGTEVFWVENAIPVAPTPPNVSLLSIVGGWAPDLTVVGGGPNPFRLEVEVATNGAVSLAIDNLPAGTVEGWTFLSGFSYFQQGIGPFFGIVPDGLTFSIITTFPQASPGNLFHFQGPPPSPVNFPAGTMAAFVGQTWDLVTLALGPGGALLGHTNVARATWQ